MSEALLQIDKVTCCYGRIPVLHGVSLDVRRNEIVALIGANGAGKTTTMMTIFGRPRASGPAVNIIPSPTGVGRVEKQAKHRMAGGAACGVGADPVHNPAMSGSASTQRVRG